MAAPELSVVEIEPATAATASIIWMHGLGADAHDFEPIVPHLGLPIELGLRFVFPNAPVRPVTINGGVAMRAWYDIFAMDIGARREDEAGLRESEQLVRQLIQREQERGIALDKIVLAGFSQGGAMTLQTGLRYPATLAGMLALSCYLPLHNTVAAERHVANQDTPILLAHGTFDPVVPYALGKRSMEKLQALGYAVDWREYPMQHEVTMAEIQHIGAWLQQILGEN